MSSKFKSLNIYKIVLQYSILVLLLYMVIRPFFDSSYLADFETYCPFGGMQALISFLVNTSLACSMTETQIFLGLALFIGVLLFGKLFCSYVCPIGTVTEWLGSLGRKWKIQITVSGIADRVLRVFKYALLFITAYFTVESSELFCKEYDPYYAIVTGFGHDVVFWYAVIGLIITIIGSIIVRQFWCKYFCPLGAITNIFTYGFGFIAIIAVYLILLSFGLTISWLWPFGIITVLGFILETVRLKGWKLPPFKITRDEILCTDCKLCDEACPIDIKVSELKTVEHIDCHLCNDCIYSCPVPNTLQINKKERRWLPATAVIVLTIIGLFAASYIELPTINKKWASDEKLEQASIYSQSGLKNVTCFGSASSFAAKMRRLKGVLGVKAFVQSNTVEVYYDPDILNEQQIKKTIFTPSRTLLRNPDKSISQISITTMDIEKLFDSYDVFYFTKLLQSNKGVFGFKTKFGEPVEANIYFSNEITSAKKIKELIESPELTYQSRGKTVNKTLKFEVSSVSDSIGTVSKLNFIKEMFSPYNKIFNGYRNYKSEDLSIYRIPMPQALSPSAMRNIKYLTAHISADTGIVRLQTVYIDKPYAQIYFSNELTDSNSVYTYLTGDTLRFQYSTGKKGERINTFVFKAKGHVIPVTPKKRETK